MPKALIPIANGTEELEAVTLADLFRRAEWDVTLVSIQEAGPIVASRGVQIIPDAQWDEIDPMHYDLLVLPGGLGGTEALCQHVGVQDAIRAFDNASRWIGAICAAPLALHMAGILDGHKFTCYPTVEQQMNRTDRSEERVVCSDHIITSQGPGTSIEFALKLIELIDSPAASTAVASGLLY